MRKAIVLAMALVVALAMTSIGPAGAAPAEKTTYEVLECLVGPDPEPDRSWFSGKDGRIWHVRGAENHIEEYMWVPHEDPEPEDLGDWVEVGTNHTVVNWNVRWMMTGFGPVPTGGSLWGKFHLDTDFGHFEGKWAWGNWPAGHGRAVGKGMHDDAGKRIKVKLMKDNPGWGDVEDASFPQNCIDTDYALMKVISPRP